MKKIILLLCLLLVPALASADPLAFRLEHVWLDQSDKYESCSDESVKETDFMASLLGKFEISTALYATGRFSYLFDRENKEWAIGIQYEFDGWGKK